MTDHNDQTPSDEHSIRRQKLEQLREMGIDPYPPQVRMDMSLKELRERFAQYEESGESVTVAGRVMSKRMHGKSSFAHIQDGTDRFQLYFKLDIVGEEPYKFYKKFVDIGDFVQVTGTLFTTRTEEQTILVKEYALLAKTLRPLPEKWHGLSDDDTRLRQRYLDILVNPEVRERFVKRAALLRAMRQFLDGKGFLEVETPILQPLYGGAFARPFDTHHNALDMKLYLRIATELYLKRLLIGGVDKVYEIGKDFRNEGIDRMHNPEFTVLEVYRSYAGYEAMMTLAEELLRHVTQATTGALSVTYQDVQTDLSGEFKRIQFWQAIAERAGRDLSQATHDELVAYLKSEGIEFDENRQTYMLIDEVFKEKVERTLVEPTFIVDYPIALSPLAKQKPGSPGIVERFELFWFGMEIANAFTELNDPHEQRRRFDSQMDFRAKGDPEAQVLDEDFITALEHGMPPAGGMGMGIDRIAMILTDSYTIRDVILFPILRPEPGNR